MNPHFKLEQLHLFLLAAKLGNFSKAAEKLGISKVAVSKSIGLLEKQLSCTLFERSTRKLTLTEAGHHLLQHAEAVLQASNELANAFSEYQTKPSGKLKLMITPYFAEHLLLPNIGRFIEAYPNLRIEMVIEERFPHLKKENIDLFIGSNMTGYDELVGIPIFKTRYVMCASPKYLQQSDILEKPEDLLSHHYITHSMRKPSNELSFDNGPAFTIDPYLIVNSTRALMICAHQHLGIIKVHEYVARNALEDNTLVEVLPDYHKKTFPIKMFYTYEKYLPQKTRLMVEFFKSLLI